MSISTYTIRRNLGSEADVWKQKVRAADFVVERSYRGRRIRGHRGSEPH